MSERTSLFAFIRWMGARVAQGSGLLSRRGPQRLSVGSNPTPSVGRTGSERAPCGERGVAGFSEEPGGTPDHDAAFPLDDATLVMLRSACEINPDSGQTHLHDFLSMGERVKSQTLLEEDSAWGAPVYEVEFEQGYEPWSEHSVIVALVDEILRLREGQHA